MRLLSASLFAFLCPNAKVEGHFKKGVKCSLKKELLVSGCGRCLVIYNQAFPVEWWMEAHCGWVGGWSREGGRRRLEPMKWREGSQDICRANSIKLSLFFPRWSRFSLEKDGNCKSGVLKGRVKIMENSSWICSHLNNFCLETRQSHWNHVSTAPQTEWLRCPWNCVDALNHSANMQSAHTEPSVHVWRRSQAFREVL